MTKNNDCQWKIKKKVYCGQCNHIVNLDYILWIRLCLINWNIISFPLFISEKIYLHCNLLYSVCKLFSILLPSIQSTFLTVAIKEQRSFFVPSIIKNAWTSQKERKLCFFPKASDFHARKRLKIRLLLFIRKILLYFPSFLLALSYNPVQSWVQLRSCSSITSHRCGSSMEDTPLKSLPFIINFHSAFLISVFFD